ncbi:uncharacterized protein LOC123879151 [Maniola jurtina]|uniref:uncharacterized protein LOC123879151 n=1 Tax=Maniola jurtina TaxID=191418 RepID=UPI001E68B274|nr:uncharacterized protein LOC123879151 [Maniola jurtina]XP_045782672.1 uncharacterized protein LOC123879151 [Maniola jurtina]
MESGGGMVAIVQASKHAGLTVTVLPEKHRCCKRNYFVLDMGAKTKSCKSNVETNTEWIPKNSSTPFWDIGYDSGYQFANCVRSPSSQQRSSYNRLPHHMVSFMQSLRQYPKVTSSADFIQKVLDYTRTKNHIKKHPRRSFLRKSTSQHTHRNGKKQENSPPHKMNISSRRHLDRSASAIGKRCSSQEEILNYTYDYLKSSSLIHRRTDVRYLTEVKKALKDRLREMMECRSTVCPKMQSRYLIHKRHCTSAKHTSDVATNPNTESQVHLPTESKAVPLEYGSSYYTSHKHSLHKGCFCQLRTPCVCKKRPDLKILNEIKDWINDIPVYPNFSEDDKLKQDQMLKELTNTLKDLLKESNFDFKAKREILKFLKALPMWHPSDANEDALFKEKLAKNLIEKFGKAAEAIFEEEITKEIENLPLNTEEINKEDIKRITDIFVDKLKLIAVNRPIDEEEYKEALKSKLLDLLEDVPLKYESQKPEMKFEIADKLANKLRTITLPASKQTTTKQQELEIEKRVSDIFKDIPELADIKASEKKEFLKFLKDKMGDYDLKDLEDSEIQQEVQKEIKAWIDNSEISERIDSKTKDKLTKKLMQELRARVKSDDDDTLDLVKNWVQGIPELSGGDETVNKALRDLATQLNEIQTSSEDPEYIQLDIRETVRDWLQNMLKNNNKRLSFTTQENFVNELVKKLNDAPHQTKYMQREDPKIMYGDVVEWIENISDVGSNIALDQSNAIEDLMNTLNDIRNNSDEELAEIQTRDAINNFLAHFSETTGVKIDPKKRKVLEQKLLGKMKQAPQQKKRWSKQNDYEISIPKAHASRLYSQSPDLSPTRELIKKWAEGIPELSGGKIENERALQDLATHLDEIQTSSEDPENIQIEMKETIADFLQNMLRRNNRRLSIATQENLVRELVKKVNDAPKQRRHMQREDPNNIYDDIVEWIKDIPGMDTNVDQNNAIEDLVNTLNDISNNSDEGLAETQTRDAINNFIEHLFETMNVKINPKKRKILEQKLLGKMKRALQQKKRCSKQNGSQSPDLSHTRDLIKKWAQNLDLFGGDRMENSKALEDLASQLNEIQTSGEDPENIQIDMKETIADWLRNMLRKNNRRLSIGTQDNLVSELVNNINEAPKLRRYMQKEDPDIMYGDVVEWMKDIPGIDSNIDLNQSNAIEDLVNTLNDIRNSSDGEFVETQTKDAISNFVEHLSETTGVEISPKQRKVVEQKLLAKIKQASQPRKHWRKQNGFGFSTPKSYAENYSLSPGMSPIRDVSVLDRQSEIDKYMNTLNNLIDSWMKRLELTIDSVEQMNLVNDIASDMVDRHRYLQVSNNKTTEADELEHLRYQIFRRLNKFNIEDLPSILSKVTDLNKALVSITVPELTKPLNGLDLTRNINNLVNSLKTWFNNIPSDLARPYNESYSDEVFIDLAKKLAEHKDSINHYHMKNEILQWIPKLFTNLSTNTLNNIADSLKNHMVNDLAQSLTQDETAGLMYRQMLWDTISKTLPSIHMTSPDDLQTFDLLKERLVDAFINLHYFADDIVALDKFRVKLSNEVNKFCNEYLRRYPDSPLNSEEIGNNLYNALRNVSVPDLETVRSELELVRLKENILDWLPEVPLDISTNIEPEMNAMASSLAKRLRGLEKEKQKDPNKDDEMKQEITKWLQKLPLRNKDQMNLQDFADKLMDKLTKSTDKSLTSIRQSLQYPKSTLSAEDRAHLNRIRRRLDYSNGKRTEYPSRDASISTPPRESFTQTGTDDRLEGMIQTGPSMYERCKMINRRVSPQVIIKEYYWDSTGSNISMREGTSDARRTCSPCSPCSKATQTTPQLIRICQRTRDSQTALALNIYPRSEEDKSCSLGTLADRNSCIPPPCNVSEEKQINRRTNLPSNIVRPQNKVDYPEDKRTYQRINLPCEMRRKSKIDTCCNCGQRIYTKCRGRHRPHCNWNCLKYCPKLNSGCPYPSNLYFKKEF